MGPRELSGAVCARRAPSCNGLGGLSRPAGAAVCDFNNTTPLTTAALQTLSAPQTYTYLVSTPPASEACAITFDRLQPACASAQPPFHPRLATRAAVQFLLQQAPAILHTWRIDLNPTCCKSPSSSLIGAVGGLDPILCACARPTARCISPRASAHCLLALYEPLIADNRPQRQDNLRQSRQFP